MEDFIFREEVIIPGSEEDYPITFDLCYNPDLRNMPVVLFCHGFKGFKDWGPWNQVSEAFAKRGIFFIKMNFSLNGVQHEDLSDIKDVEAFGKNTLTTELKDLKLMLDWLTDDNEIYRHYMDAENMSLIGHSRSAATVLIQTIEDDRILRTISWAGAFNLKKFAELEADEVWKARGYTEIQNARTGDTYPIQYGFRQDFLDNAGRLDLTKKLAELDQPLLMIHGTNDTVSPISNARKVHQFITHSLLIENEGDHTFGGKHPWDEMQLPEHLAEVVQNSIDFIVL